MRSSPGASRHAVTPSTVVPQLVPLLDLLADLLAKDLLRERSKSDADLERQVSDTNAIAAAQGNSAVVEKHGKRRSLSQFPSKFPSKVLSKSH
jgi:hypothetical protein